jgi:hypothetical protein
MNYLTKKIDIQQGSEQTVLLLLLIRNPVLFILLGHSYRAHQAATAGLFGMLKEKMD